MSQGAPGIPLSQITAEVTYLTMPTDAMEPLMLGNKMSCPVTPPGTTRESDLGRADAIECGVKARVGQDRSASVLLQLTLLQASSWGPRAHPLPHDITSCADQSVLGIEA